MQIRRKNSDLICEGEFTLKELAEKFKADLWGADLREAENIPSQFASNLSLLKWQKNLLVGFKYLNGQISPYQNFTYEIGGTYICGDGNSDSRIPCDKGINLATLEWCLSETNNDLSKTYAVFEFYPSDILAIPYNSDGKFRVKKATYLRNLTDEEIKEAIKPLYPEVKVSNGAYKPN